MGWMQWLSGKVHFDGASRYPWSLLDSPMGVPCRCVFLSMLILHQLKKTLLQFDLHFGFWCKCSLELSSTAFKSLKTKQNTVYRNDSQPWLHGSIFWGPFKNTSSLPWNWNKDKLPRWFNWTSRLSNHWYREQGQFQARCSCRGRGQWRGWMRALKQLSGGTQRGKRDTKYGSWIRTFIRSTSLKVDL